MEKRESIAISKKGFSQCESFTDSLFEKVDDHTFRIKINVHFRRLGVKDIVIADRQCLIRSRDDVIVHVKNY